MGEDNSRGAGRGGRTEGKDEVGGARGGEGKESREGRVLESNWGGGGEEEEGGWVRR